MGRAASASAGSADGSPTTPFCTSEVTTAVWRGSTSSASGGAGMRGEYLTDRQADPEPTGS